jgi:hypothetical protein
MKPRAEPSPLRTRTARVLLLASLLLVPKCLLCLGAWLGFGVLMGAELCGPAPAFPVWAYPAAAATLVVGAIALHRPTRART